MKKTCMFAAMAAVSILVLGVSAQAKPEIGKPAPAFTLEDHNGNKVSLADLKGKIVVLEWWNEGCPVCVRHAQAGSIKNLVTRYGDKGVVVLGINSTASCTNASNKKAYEQFKLNYVLLNDASGQVGRAYDAKTTPHMYIIDKEGVLVYNGAIDDDPGGNKAEKVNYVAKALDELLAGKAVSTPETRPYGCSVKYAK